MHIDWSSVLIVIVCVASLVAIVWLDEKVKEWRKPSFPLFKLTDGEGDCLAIAYNRLDTHTYFLCFAVAGTRHKDSASLRNKINRSLGSDVTLGLWKGGHLYYCLTTKEHQELRKQWIVALLEYNNMQEKLK